MDLTKKKVFLIALGSILLLVMTGSVYYTPAWIHETAYYAHNTDTKCQPIYYEVATSVNISRNNSLELVNVTGIYSNIKVIEAKKWNRSTVNDWDEDNPPELPPIPPLSAPILPRPLAKEKYLKLIELVRTLNHVLSINNHTMFIFHGTLLGSYRMHDILSWDEDIDVLAPAAKKQKIVDLLNRKDIKERWQLNGMAYNGYIKVWFSNSPKKYKYPWGFPFIDLFLYHESPTHVWAAKGQAYFKLSRDVIFPLHKRPLGSTWLPAPNKPYMFLKDKYKGFTTNCKKHTWNHMLEKGQKSVNIACESLHKFYPYITRTSHPAGVIETLFLDGKLIYSTIVHERNYEKEFLDKSKKKKSR